MARNNPRLGLFPALRTAARSANRGALELSSPWTPNPSHLERWVWADLYGDTSYLPLTRAEAMSVAPLARARHLIVGTAARLPMAAYRVSEWVDPQPRWIDRSDMPTSPYHRMLWTYDDLLFEGWSLWMLDRNDAGFVIAADRVPVDLWSFDENGLVMIGGQYPDPSTSLCLIPGPHEGLLQFARRTIRHASNLIGASDRAAETPTPNIELHQTTDKPMSDESVGELVASWAKARRGANGGVAFTNSAVEVIEHGAHAENLLIEGRNAAAVDIARACGIPASMIDASLAGSAMTYQNVAARNREFIDYGLAPYLSAVSARLGMDDIVPRGQRIAYDLEEYLAGNLPGLYGVPDESASPANPNPTSAAPPATPNPAASSDTNPAASSSPGASR